MKTLTGGCMCGRIRYTADVASDEAYLCHCRMCQRSSGNVSLALVNAVQANVRFETTPDYYVSSPIARRPFCRECGTSLGFVFNDSKNMDLTVASFDDPRFFRCTSHCGVESRLDAWWRNLEGMPEHRTDQLQHVVDKWMKTAGEMPPSLGDQSKKVGES